MTPCIEFDGARDQDGYGMKSREGRMHRAHRLAYMDSVGPIPAGIRVLHRCDNPPCINPEHLFLGTHDDNMQDKLAKGRNCYGTDNGQTKLNAAKVIDIRLRMAGGESMCSIGRVYGVDFKTVRDIRDGKTWKHVGIYLGNLA